METSNLRRINPRAPVFLRATIHQGDQEFACQLLQLSRGGLFMRYAHEAPLPQRLKVGFSLPMAGPQLVEVDVRYRLKRGAYRGDETAAGAGCAFVHISAQTQAAIVQYIARMASTYSQLSFQLAIKPPGKDLARLLTEVGLGANAQPERAREAVFWGLKQMGR